ncbi:RHS repeat-associated core domain-containing protein, partial [Marinobacter manganoxydans]
AATDSTGAVVWQQAYDPWGFKLTVNTDERGYTGNWLDEETGLADHKARWYTSSIGRFTGIDPVKWHETNIHSFNRYAYGNNNPYSYADPDGELAFPVVPILGVLAFEALGIVAEVGTMEETSDSINRSGAGTYGVTGVKAVGFAMRMGLKGANVSKGLSKGDQVVTRTTRKGDNAVRITREDGSVIDISPTRVKEFTPNTHPKAPPGSLQKTKFENSLPGSKGFKRAPTQQELDLLKDLTK